MGSANVGPIVPLGTFSQQAATALGGGPLVPIAASGAIAPHAPNNYIITKAGVAAMTLGAPTAGTDDGLVITVYSSTANAHTVTATGLYVDGAGHVNVATFAANIGASFSIIAYQGKWYVQGTQGVTMS
jgi:hypothetical protein